MKKGKKLCQVLIPLSVAFTVIALFRWMFFIGYVPTSSMEPTLKTGSVLLGIRISVQLKLEILSCSGIMRSCL